VNALNARATSAPTCSYGCGSRSSTAGVCVCARARACASVCHGEEQEGHQEYRGQMSSIDR